MMLRAVTHVEGIMLIPSICNIIRLDTHFQSLEGLFGLGTSVLSPGITRSSTPVRALHSLLDRDRGHYARAFARRAIHAHCTAEHLCSLLNSRKACLLGGVELRLVQVEACAVVLYVDRQHIAVGVYGYLHLVGVGILGHISESFLHNTEDADFQ